MNRAGANSNIMYNPPYQAPVGGAITYTGGSGGTLMSGARDILDARRLMDTGHVPSAEYPDGYLGTIGAGTRRQDRLLNNIGNRATQRSYQRGVHKGRGSTRPTTTGPRTSTRPPPSRPRPVASAGRSAAR